METNSVEHAVSHQEGKIVQIRQTSSYGEIDRVEEKINGCPSFQCNTSTFGLYSSNDQLILDGFHAQFAFD